MQPVRTTTPSVTALLAKTGFETPDAIFEAAGAVTDGCATQAVAMRLWMAFSDFESAEKDYARCLSSVLADVDRQADALKKGNTVEPSWVLHNAQRLAAAGAKMASATETILTMSHILAKLV